MWSRNIGNKGEIFFKGRRLDTYKQIETAAKDMKILMNRSDDIIDKVMGQYLLMNKKNISPVELVLKWCVGCDLVSLHSEIS